MKDTPDIFSLAAREASCSSEPVSQRCLKIKDAALPFVTGLEEAAPQHRLNAALCRAFFQLFQRQKVSSLDSATPLKELIWCLVSCVKCFWSHYLKPLLSWDSSSATLLGFACAVGQQELLYRERSQPLREGPPETHRSARCGTANLPLVLGLCRLPALIYSCYMKLPSPVPTPCLSFCCCKIHWEKLVLPYTAWCGIKYHCFQMGKAWVC